MRTSYLVCYDISNDLLLRRVHKTMVGVGDRLQYSVFECRFTAADLARCRHALAKLIHHREAYSTLDGPCRVVDRERGCRRTGWNEAQGRGVAARAQTSRRRD